MFCLVKSRRGRFLKDGAGLATTRLFLRFTTSAGLPGFADAMGVLGGDQLQDID